LKATEEYALEVHHELARLASDPGCANGPVRDVLRKLGPPPQDRRGITLGGPSLILSGPSDSIDQFIAAGGPLIVSRDDG
jgi:hypothetical protein